MIDSKYQTQLSPKFRAAVKLGPYVHKPDRRDRNKCTDSTSEGTGDTGNRFAEEITEEEFLEYQRRMENGENIIIHDFRKTDGADDGTAGGISVEKELVKLKDFHLLSAKQAEIIKQVIESGVKTEELNDLNLPAMTPEQIKTTMEGFYGLSFDKKP